MLKIIPFLLLCAGAQAQKVGDIWKDPRTGAIRVYKQTQSIAFNHTCDGWEWVDSVTPPPIVVMLPGVDSQFCKYCYRMMPKGHCDTVNYFNSKRAIDSTWAVADSYWGLKIHRVDTLTTRARYEERYRNGKRIGKPKLLSASTTTHRGVTDTAGTFSPTAWVYDKAVRAMHPAMSTTPKDSMSIRVYGDTGLINNYKVPISKSKKN